MIPQKLTIQGIYSYQEEQVIDFEKLTQSKLFGVFGAVGSGKSTLLEAISFALYGQTERLGKRDNLGYNMMNLKSNELFIDFEFLNYDNRRYKFIVEGKRNSKRFDDVKTFQRRAFVQENNEWNPLETTSAESIIGLSYDNFRRTIIIPQGKFQEFLQLKDKERTEMLKEIFNLSKFDYFYQITSLGSSNDKAKEKLLGQLSHYESLNEETIALVGTNYKKSLEASQKLKKELEVISLQEKSLALLKESFTQLASKKEDLVNHHKQKEAIEVSEKTYNKYEYALIHFKDRLAQIEKFNIKELKLNKDSLEIKKTLNLTNERLKLKEKEQVQLKVALDKIPQEEKEIKDLSLILKINDSTKVLKDNEESLTKGKLFIDHLNLEIETLEKELSTLEREYSEAKRKQLSGSSETFTALLIWFSEFENYQAEVKRVEKEILEETNSYQRQKEALVSQLKGPQKELELKNENQLRTIVEKEEKALIKTKKEEQDLTNKLTDFKVKQELEKWSTQIEDGKPCPLCGALEHPEVMSSASVNEHVLIADKELLGIKEKIKVIDFNLFKLNSLINLFNQEKEKLAALAVSKEKSIQKLNLKEQSFKNKSYSVKDIDLVKKDFEIFKKQENSLTIIKNNIEKKHELLRTNIKKKEQYKVRFESIEAKTKTALLEINTYQNQLVLLKPSNYLDNKEIQLKVEELERSISKTKTNIETIELELKELTKKQIIQQETINSLTKELNSLTKEIVIENKLLKIDLTKSPFETKNEVIQLLNSAIDLEALKKKVSNYKLTEHALKTAIAQLEKDLKSKTFDSEVYKNLQQEVVIKTKALEVENEQRIKLENELSKAQKDFKIKQELSKEFNLLELRGDNISILKSLFKASGFVNYISSVYLQNLCSEANIRFAKLTKQQLKLEINDKNEFLVRDFLNEGKVRSVKTLSGGQLFQASLSLALALAESIQEQNNANQNFFFLDEGFGSQDKESLQIVFESLKALRKENRIVGVISHVEELQQEISTYLSIINHNDVGSKIMKSWE
jgi:exonuclease SbcC